MRWVALIAIMLVHVNMGAPFSRESAGATELTTEDPLQPLARKVFNLVNRQRQLHGLHPLEWNDALAAQARLQSTNMMERGFFAHVDPVRGRLAARLNAAGIHWTRCGENIFRDSGEEEPESEAVDGWMKSPSHRSSILDSLFTETGIGLAISPSTEYYITQIFLRP